VPSSAKTLMNSKSQPTKKKSYLPLSRRALEYAIAGVTSLDEVMRITGGLDEEIEPIVSDPSAVAEARS